jgi:hypothetical protein
MLYAIIIALLTIIATVLPSAADLYIGYPRKAGHFISSIT